jgi:class 3 adenylate cyclase
VVYTDMVGYNRLIERDDLGTLERLRTLRDNPAINEHGGRLVQTGGDSLLIMFDSIDGAVRCAGKMQQQSRLCRTLLRLTFAPGFCTGHPLRFQSPTFGTKFLDICIA